MMFTAYYYTIYFGLRIMPNALSITGRVNTYIYAVEKWARQKEWREEKPCPARNR